MFLLSAFLDGLLAHPDELNPHSAADLRRAYASGQEWRRMHISVNSPPRREARADDQNLHPCRRSIS